MRVNYDGKELELVMAGVYGDGSPCFELHNLASVDLIYSRISFSCRVTPNKGCAWLVDDDEYANHLLANGYFELTGRECDNYKEARLIKN